MCFDIKRNKNGKNEPMKIAENDIVCYKSGSHNEDYTQGKPKFVSAVMNFEYAWGKTNRTKLEKVTENSSDIDDGFHSFRYKKDAIEEAGIADVYRAVKLIVRCVIPKGSKYHVNEVHYVSDKIIIVEPLNAKSAFSQKAYEKYFKPTGK